MLKLIDRYVLKEIIPPFFLGLMVYSFVLLMNQILLLAEMFIDRGVELKTVLSLLIYLVPSVLAFTIPMSVLMGILAGLSRMSSDSEIMAFKTLGISNKRLLRPILLFAFCGWLFTSFFTLYSAPRANYKWVQTLAHSVLTRVQFTIQPREFNESIRSTVIYIQDITPEKDWKNVFVYYNPPDEDARIAFAQTGRLNVFGEEERAILELFQGAIHGYDPATPETYNVTEFEHREFELDVGNLFASVSAGKRVREKDIQELWEDVQIVQAELEAEPEDDPNSVSLWNMKRNVIAHWIEIHKKFALPFSCFIFAFLGIALGATTRKGGRTSGFTISIAIIIVYYILITAGENLAMDGYISPWLGMWGPNILLSLLGLVVFISSYRESNVLSGFLRIFKSRGLSMNIIKKQKTEYRQPRFSLWFPNILDRYIIRKYLAIFFLAFFSMLAIFIIITFFERIDTVYEHNKSLALFFDYIWYKIPEFVHLILPVTALTSTLLSLGLLTKFNEITAMKACGVSVYRAILPVVFLACVVSFCSFYLQENILPSTNKKADELWNKINDRPPSTYTRVDRRWVMDKRRSRVYHYRYFDPIASAFSQLSIYDIDSQSWSFKRRIFAEKGFLQERNLSLVNCWYRDFDGNFPINYEKKEQIQMAVAEDRSYFMRELRVPDQMGYQELKNYIQNIEERGFDSTRFRVDLLYKISFPLVSLIMVFIGIPFAFSMGKRGALVGLGISVVIAMFYWGGVGIFKSLGYANFLSPILAAWGPNMIFGLIGLYLLFTLRT